MAPVFFLLCNILLVSVASSTNAAVNLKLDKTLADPLVFAIVLPVLQTEILANSVGIRTDTFLSLANDSYADRATQVTSISIVKLWTDLRTTEKSLRTLSNTIVNLIKENPDANMTYDDIIKKLNEAYIQDPELGTQYELFKEETNRNLTAPKFLSNGTAFAALSDDEKKELLEVELGPGMMLLHFTQELISGTNKNYQLVAKACFRFAKDDEHYKKIQKIFEEALKDGARFGYKKSTSKQVNTLFANLRQKIIHDVDLKNALSKMKIVLPDKL